MDKVRVLRIIEIVGPRDLVEKQVANSIHGERLGAKSADGQVVIRAATVGNYPEILESSSLSYPLGYPERCAVISKGDFCSCSLPIGHGGPHIAYPNHDPKAVALEAWNG